MKCAFSHTPHFQVYLFAESNWSQRGQLLHILEHPERGHLLPVPNTTRSHMAHILINDKLLQSWEVYSQINYEYHGLFHQSFTILTLEIEVASGQCFPHPSIILRMPFKVSPLLSQYVWHLYQFVDTKTHTPVCINTFSQLTYNFINAALLICLKSTLH